MKNRRQKRLVLLRHGQSVWNRENRFTGWADVDLSAIGIEEAYQAGEIMAAEGLTFDRAYTSYLKRAIRTLNCVLERMNLDWIPVEKSWRLNEKHYGALQGLNKELAVIEFGAEQVQLWRRGWASAPERLGENDPRNARFDPRYAAIPNALLPRTESLEITCRRILPIWQNVILPAVGRYDDILVVAHGNSLRAIIKTLKNIPDHAIADVNIPTGIPYLFEFGPDMRLSGERFLGNEEKIAKRTALAAATSDRH